MSKLRVEHNTIYINDNKIEFQHTLKDVKKCGDYYIVLTDTLNINNVYAIDLYAQIVWQIEDAGIVYDFINDVPYAGMRINELNQIIVTNFNGVTFTVDVLNGKIASIGFTK